MNNTGSLSNGSVFQIASGGVVNNSGIFGNAGAALIVQTGGRLNNSGVLLTDSNSTFTMAAGTQL